MGMKYTHGTASLGLWTLIFCFCSYIWYREVIREWLSLTGAQESLDERLSEVEERLAGFGKDPIKMVSRQSVSPRKDLPWLKSLEIIPHVDIPLFDVLRKNSQTRSQKVANNNSV